MVGTLDKKEHMQPRLAKKIVTRVQEGTANHTSYGLDQVRSAFRVMGVDLKSDYLQPWNDHLNRPRGDPKTFAAQAAAKKAQKEARILALTEKREMRVLRRRKAIELAEAIQAQKAAMEAAQAAKDDKPEMLVERFVQTPPENDVVEEVEQPKVEETPADLESLKVPELKALAKSRNIEGTSKMKKAELIQALQGS